LDAGERGDRLVDRLLDHRPRRAAHRREGVHDLDVLALDLRVVVEAELDDVHAELRVLDTMQCLDDVVLRDHGRTVAARRDYSGMPSTIFPTCSPASKASCAPAVPASG